MDCGKFEEVIHDIDRPGMKIRSEAGAGPGVLPGIESVNLREAALVHAESCSRCAQLLTEIESLDFAFHSISSLDVQEEQDVYVSSPSARMEAVLLQEFRKQKAESARRRMGWQAAAIGIAAMMLLALGLSVHYTLGRRTIPSGAGAGTNAGTSKRSAADYRPQLAQQGDAAAQDQATGQTGDSDYVAAFTPLPYADDPQALDGGAVVRVALSPTALASLGLPVAEPGENQSVSADLLVSGDGTPQAIRWVSQ